MIDLIDEMRETQERLDDLESKANSRVQRVVDTYRMLRKEKAFTNDSESTYSLDGSQYAVLKVTHIPSYFDRFEIHKGYLRATGTYYGSYGYSERETVTVPVRWMSYSDDRLEAAMMRRWAQVLSDREKEDSERKEAEKLKRLEKYKKLKEEFE